ncbi:MAG TPA: hypothetical protein DEZ08_08570 [Dehalococcoidia bacterium]|jgi:extradiol dioxygenase family protein|nr:hypothetical protein [Dehalococcoidia bacterium]
MFSKIQHLGYQVANLDKAQEWFLHIFGGEFVPGRTSPNGGRNGFVHFGQIEIELIQPADTSFIPDGEMVMHHVGYLVPDISEAVLHLSKKGFKFVSDTPNVNILGQKVLYFDSTTTNNCNLHLTELPASPNTAGYGSGLPVIDIVHAGYLVKDVSEAVAWYEEKFDAVTIGGIGASRRGARNAYVNFGNVQAELIETDDLNLLKGETIILDHIGLVVDDIQKEIGTCQTHGVAFVAEQPMTNRIGQQLLYFNKESSLGTGIHLTQLPLE